MEDRPVVALQGHLDMVHQKNASVDFDFDSDGIRMKVDGEWLKAEGTTLGADNGLGVAYMLAVLATTPGWPRLKPYLPSMKKRNDGRQRPRELAEGRISAEY